MNRPPGMPRVPRSMALWQRAEQLIPGGSQLVSRRPSRYAHGVSPVFAARAKGARFWDVDGYEYIDWVSGIGAIILGYADDEVDEAVCRQLRDGTVYSINHQLEVELAEELVARIPCAEMVRYAKGGGEACAIAVRIARGVTGRDSILFCGYHGWHDWYLAANLSSDASLDAHLFPGIEPIGVPRSLRGTAAPFPYGDLAALEQALETRRGEVAAVILEPLRSELPPKDYLRGVAELARRFGALLIFDEVSTGFRPSDAGVQPLFDALPDMAVFAKSISNGYAMGVVVGRREVMRPAARMFISSTYWSDTIGLRAALTTLQAIRRRGVPEQLERLGSELQTRLNQTARECGAPVHCGGVAHHPQLRFEVPDRQRGPDSQGGPDSQLQAGLATLYIQEMARRGCHGYPAFYLNAAQGAPEVEDTLAAARETFALLAEAAEHGSVEPWLQCETRSDPFRRLVR